ncbi:MAG: kinase/pyrophosphorylase [candidate division Zixibacteria bacterium]|nr:kinase/pyrophosphorylase [candidate division Zixibacteria bacterium]
MDEIKNIVIISDGTGKTAHRLMDAVLIQYYEKDISFSLINTFQNVRSRKSINEVLKQIKDDYLVLFSIISKDLAEYLSTKLSKRRVIHLNVLKPMLDVTSKFLGVHPDYMPGKLQIVNDNYYRKIDAIDYAVRHDDGRGDEIERADVVLLGISRTCKTPISMYLACNFGLNMANIPLVPDPTWVERVLRRLLCVKTRKIVGLIMQPDTLASIRESRSKILVGGSEQLGELMDYYDIRKVTQEFRFSTQLFEAHKWQVVDVTRRAIEEISIEIMEYIGYKR